MSLNLSSNFKQREFAVGMISKYSTQKNREGNLIDIVDRIGDAYFNITKMNNAISYNGIARRPFSEDVDNMKRTLKLWLCAK